MLILFLLKLLCFNAANATEIPYIDLGNSFINSVDRGNHSAANELLFRGEDVNVRGKYGITALMRAAIRDDESMLKLLLKHDADLSATDFGGATALHLATRFNNITAVKALLAENADVTIADNDGWTPLMLAIKNQQLAILKLFQGHVRQSSNLINHKNFEGLNSLTMAIATDKLPIVQIVFKMVQPDQVKKEQILKIAERRKPIHEWLSEYLNQAAITKTEIIEPYTPNSLQAEHILNQRRKQLKK